MKKCKKCKSKLKKEVYSLYEDRLLGIPGVYIRNAAVREYCPKCRRDESVIIPNLQGLVAAVAVHRVMLPLKLNPEEIVFLRKACEWPAKMVAEKLDVRPETVSRWENGRETMSPQSEKLFRLFVGDKLHRTARAISYDPQAIGNMKLQPVSRQRLIMHFQQQGQVTQTEQALWKEEKRYAYGGRR